MAGGHVFLFATMAQWAAHWNTFHVAVAPVFNCMVRSCSFETTAGPDSLDALFHHLKDAHRCVYDEGRWLNLVDLVVRGHHVKPNAQYSPPATQLGEVQRPASIMKPTSTQLLSPIVAARWAARKHFHRVMVARRCSYKRAQRRESKSGEHSSSASKGAPKVPSESGAQTFSESADEWA